MAFGYIGDMQFEVIENVSGKSTYSEFLDRVPQGGVHHLGYSVDDYDAAANDLGPAATVWYNRGFWGHQIRLFREPDDPGS